jgi:hypothetical protein
MHSIREELHLDVGIGLEGHGDLPRYGLTASLNGLRDLYAYKPGRGRHIVLPAAPDYSIALAHEKAITRFHAADRTVKIRQHGRIAAIDDIQEQPVVSVLKRNGLEYADIRRATHQAMCIPRGEVQVSDPDVAGMVRVDSEVHRAIQLFVWADITKGYALRKGAAGLDLKGCDRHRAPP